MSGNKWEQICKLVEQPAKDPRFNWTTTMALLQQIYSLFEDLRAEELPKPDSPHYLPIVAARTIKKLLYLKGMDFGVVVQQFTRFCLSTLDMMGACIQRENAEVPVELANEYAELLRFVLTESTQALNEAPKTLYDKYKELCTNYGIDLAEGVSEFLFGMSAPTAAILESPMARKIIRGDEEIQNCARPMRFLKKTAMIYQLANILDEEITVLYPAQNKGWNIDISGIATNGQLYALITNAIQTADKSIGGPLIPARGVKVLQGEGPQKIPGLFYIYSLTMANWTILQKTTIFPLDNKGASHWLWDDGVPSEVSKFNGKRIIVIDKSKIPRKMDLVRIFPKIKAHATIKKTMTGDEVKSLITEITASPAREEAIESRAWIYNKAE